MTSKEHVTIHNKEQKNKENMINLGDSDSKKVEEKENKHRSPSLKAMQMKEKEKSRIKNAILNKINNEVEIVEENNTRIVLDITIREGRNRQIRRMCELAGLRVERLTRIAEGPIRLGDLPIGKMRQLTEKEIAAVMEDSAT